MHCWMHKGCRFIIVAISNSKLVREDCKKCGVFAGRANLHQCSAGEHNGPQHSGEPERIANGQDPAEPPSDNDQIPEWVAEEDDEEDPGPPRRCEPAAEGNEAAIAATARPRKRKTQQNSKRVAADEPPSRAMPSAKRRGRASRQPVDKGGVWEAAGEAKEEGLDHLGEAQLIIS